MALLRRVRPFNRTVADMADKYPSFHALRQSQVEGHDFAITLQCRHSEVAVVAPHGGLIETGSTAIALAIAADALSYYHFDGLQPGDNQHLHITSTQFDEPRCLELIATAATVLTVHGERSEGDVVFLGGLDEALGERLRSSLSGAGFQVATHGNPKLQGRHVRNICNLGRSGKGVQLELSRGLRRSFFHNLYSVSGVVANTRLAVFSEAVRRATRPID